MYVCVCGVFYPTLGAHMEVLIKLWHYLEQEHGTLGAKLILSVHIPCKGVCVLCVCEMATYSQENWATVPRNCAKHAYEYVW